MAIKTQIAKLANKEMSRREFLKYSGVIFLSAIGITGLMRMISSFGDDSGTSNGAAAQRNFYGSSKFGR